MPDLAHAIAAHNGKGYVTAPAGFGKIQCIAEAIARASDRQLVLTHTYAGVNALRDRFRALDIESDSYRVTTIASWALQLCLSYPQTADWNIENPSGSEWRHLYEKCRVLLTIPFIRKIVRASYSGAYVDEYQDCVSSQHNLVVALTEILPTCVLGDPLQSIFEFSDEAIVDWANQVEAKFQKLGELETPWRWNNVNSVALGTWLSNVRVELEARKTIDLTAAPPDSAKIYICGSEEELRNKQISVCKYHSFPDGDRVAAIHKGDSRHKAKTHLLAKNTGGRFCSIEEIEGKRLLDFARAYDERRSAADRLVCSIKFAKKTMSKVDTALSSGTKRGEPVEIRKTTKNPDVVSAANDYLKNPTPQNLKGFLLQLCAAPETRLCSRDLFNRALQVMTKSEELDLSVEAGRYLRDFRHVGRPVRHPCVIGTTLLLKGLEFDHAIVLDATSLSRKELYVALTRGSKSLTVLSRATVLRPSD